MRDEFAYDEHVRFLRSLIEELRAQRNEAMEGWHRAQQRERALLAELRATRVRVLDVCHAEPAGTQRL